MKRRLLGNVIGLSLALPPLVPDNVFLVRQQFPVQALHQKAHPVALKPQRKLQLVAGHGLKVVGAVKVRGAVDARPTDRLNNPDVRLLSHMFRALEHHVFKKMRKSRPPRSLVQRAHVIPKVHGHHWQPVIFVRNYRQAIGQRVLRVLDHG